MIILVEDYIVMAKKYVLNYSDHKIRLKFPVKEIGHFCEYNAPSILIHDCQSNLVDFSRSPYWVFCPHLIRRIHSIESSGWVKILQDFIQGPLADQWLDFTMRVPNLLKTKLSSDYYSQLMLEGRANIGGVKDPFHLKCLHAHYSFFKIHGEGWVGQFVENLLIWRSTRKQDTPLLACHPEFLECNYHGVQS